MKVLERQIPEEIPNSTEKVRGAISDTRKRFP
jgi:hypothetical protein